MLLGIMHLELDIEHAQSLKDKRGVLNSLKDRIRRKFNVSIAEVADHDVWNFASLGVVVVSNDQKFCNRVLDKVIDHVEAFHDCEIADYSMEFMRL
jgi:uncharacterized protein YlxP (DUF503 family)